MPADPAKLPQLIESSAGLAALAERFADAHRLAFDTESASFHRYVDRVYLIQISTDDDTVLIDPLAIDDLDPVGRLLAAPTIEVVFHDADYDLRTLDRDYAFRARRLFDTRIAAQLAGEPGVSLGALLERHRGIKLDKKHQRADWSRRPLPAELIQYAAADTRYLLSLRDALEHRLRQLGRLEWAREEFHRLERVRWTGPSDDDEDGFLRMKGAKALKPRALEILKRLYEWRDETARRHDKAPFRIIGNSALLAIARSAPRDMRQLLALNDVPQVLARRHGRDLLRAVRRGLAARDHELPRIKRGKKPERDADYEARVDRLKALRNRRARELDLDPGVLCPNATLHQIADARPATPDELGAVAELRQWQREVLGEGQLLTAVKGET